MSARPPRRAIDGVLLLDKPAGLSSTSALGWAKRVFNAAKAGHAGTLDPFATGLLPICLGEAAKFSRFLLDADKGYLATLRLGARSSTGDTEGEVVASGVAVPTLERIRTVIASFRGEGMQTPPMHSAIKQDGVALYKLARAGKVVTREPRRIQVYRMEVVSKEGDCLVLDARVSKGTYLRVLAEDIGEALGCGAYLTGLRRTSTAGFDIAQSVRFDQLEAWTMSQREASLLTADSLASSLPALQLSGVHATAIKNGQRVTLPGGSLSCEGHVRVYDENGGFLGVATATLDTGSANWVLVVLRLMATGGHEETP